MTKLDRVRQAVADYMRSEGCSCCQNQEDHEAAKVLLAGLLGVPMYDDGSGYDFNQFSIKMTKIYAVSAGCYSDYRIHAMFSTRELAQEYIDKAQKVKEEDGDNYNVGGVYWSDDSPSIEEWTLDGEADAKVRLMWRCGILLDDGSLVEPAYEQKVFEGSPQTKSRVIQCGVKVPAYKDRPIVRVESYKSAEHALKMAAEQRQKWIREKAAQVDRRVKPVPEVGTLEEELAGEVWRDEAERDEERGEI